MELALVTAQRREDIAAIEFRQVKDSTAWIDGDALFVIQQKTGMKVRIPLCAGLNGWTIGGTVRQCRDSTISRYLLHPARTHGCRKRPTIDLADITRAFAKCRDLAGIAGEEGKSPPTFHEIRSLAIRIYSEQYGKDFGQAIAGHKDASTTDLYRDTRGSEWVLVKAG